MKHPIRLLALAGLLVGSVQAQTSLVSNGSFELGPPLPTQGYLPVGPGSGIIDDWIITRGQIDIVAGGLIASSEGLRSLDMNGSPGSGGVQQSLATQAGHSYVVLFDLWRNVGGPLPNGATLEVQALSNPESYLSIGSDGWTARAYVFDAIGGATDVELYSAMLPGVAGPMLDRVEAYESLGTSICMAAPNSTGIPARMFVVGSDAVASNELSLVAVDLPKNQFGYFLVSQTAGNVPLVGGGQGTLCLSGAIGRFNSVIQNSHGRATIRIPVDLGALPQPNGPVAVQPGDTWIFQLWYRDTNPTPTSNLSDAVAVTFG